jgi:hypothetical protein
LSGLFHNFDFGGTLDLAGVNKAFYCDCWRGVMTVIEKLKLEADLLTEPLAQEVLGFLLSVRGGYGAGRASELFEHTAGAWKGEPELRQFHVTLVQRISDGTP